jgi:peroxiredoxin (alkyl hydroperoxide reductase subunit C)
VAQTTQGSLDFPKDYQGKWVVLFSHPADFTPVCTSEFIMFGALAHEFEQLNTQLVGLSIGSLDQHQAWLRSIQDQVEYLGIKNLKIPFPVIADEDQEIAWRYGMLHPQVSSTQTVRAMFIIDPQGMVRAFQYYPNENGRNVSEIKRLLMAMQLSDTHKVATGANWQPGDQVIVHPDKAKKENCQTEYFCLQTLNKNR